MKMKTLSRIDVLYSEWNKARTVYYANQSEANETRMDDALRALLNAKEAEKCEPAEVLCI